MCLANYVDIVWLIKSASVPPNMGISKLVQYIKGKSSRKVLMEFEQLKKKYCGQHIRAKGYFAVTVGNLNEQ
ncbi:transposase [Alphaproteobacteria bacterium]